MSTSKPFATDEESVLMAFSMEVEPWPGNAGALHQGVPAACDRADRLFDRSAS